MHAALHMRAGSARHHSLCLAQGGAGIDAPLAVQDWPCAGPAELGPAPDSEVLPACLPVHTGNNNCVQTNHQVPREPSAAECGVVDTPRLNVVWLTHHDGVTTLRSVPDDYTFAGCSGRLQQSAPASIKDVCTLLPFPLPH